MQIEVNGRPREVPDGQSIADLLADCDHPRHVAVEVNLELVPREKHADHRLQSGDQVELVTLVGGG